MKRVLAAIVLLLLAVPFAAAGEIVDRVLVVVNNSVVLASDLDEAVRYEALVQGREVTTFGDADVKATLDRLVDQELLRQQMVSLALPPVTDAEIAAQVAELRKNHAGAQTAQGWKSLLTHYGLTERAVARRVRAQIELLHFVEVRLRPDVRVDRAAVEAYYRDKLTPQLRQRGAAVPPQAEVEQNIREVLAEERVDEMLSVWLHNLRQQGRIRVMPPVMEQAARN